MAALRLCFLVAGNIALALAFLEYPNSTSATHAHTQGGTGTTNHYVTQTQPQGEHCTCNVNLQNIPTSSSQPTCTSTQAFQIKINQLEDEINLNYQDINKDNDALKITVAKLQDDVTKLKGMATELMCARNNTRIVAEAVQQLRNLILINSTLLQPEHCIPVIQVPQSSGQTTLPRDCLDVYAANNTQPGVYLIQPDRSPKAMSAYCEKGWTYIQRRYQGQTLNFDQYWDAYSMGFNDSSGDLWLGNEHVYYLTNQGEYTLRVEAEGWTGKVYWAQYDTFYIDDEAGGYALHVGNYTGNYKDILGISDSAEFSSKDVDNDNYSSGNCAQEYTGGWWYDDCKMSLNRRLLQHDSFCANFYDRCVKTSSMKIIRTVALTYI